MAPLNTSVMSMTVQQLDRCADSRRTGWVHRTARRLRRHRPLAPSASLRSSSAHRSAFASPGAGFARHRLPHHALSAVPTDRHSIAVAAPFRVLRPHRFPFAHTPSLSFLTACRGFGFHTGRSKLPVSTKRAPVMHYSAFQRHTLSGSCRTECMLWKTAAIILKRRTFFCTWFSREPSEFLGEPPDCSQRCSRQPWSPV